MATIILTLDSILSTSIDATAIIDEIDQNLTTKITAYLYDVSGLQVDCADYSTVDLIALGSGYGFHISFDGLAAGSEYTLKVDFISYTDSSFQTGVVESASKTFITSAIDDCSEMAFSGDQIAQDDSPTTYIVPGSYEPNFYNVQVVQDFSQTTDTSIGVYVTGLDPDYDGEWEIYIALKDVSDENHVGSPVYYFFTAMGGSPTDTCVFTGIHSDTAYLVHLIVGYQVDGENRSFELKTAINEDNDYYTPDFVNTEVRIISATTNSVTLQIVGLDSNYESNYGWEIIHRVFLNSHDGDLVTGTHNNFNVPAGSESSGRFTFSGLTVEQKYYIQISLFYKVDGEILKADLDIYPFYLDDYIGGADEEEPDCNNLHIRKVQSDSDTALSFVVSGLDENYTGEWAFTWQLSITGGIQIGSLTTYADGGDYSSDVAEFTGLYSEQLYNVKVTISYTYNGYWVDWGSLEGTFSPNDSYIDMGSARIVAESSSDGKTVSAYVTGLGTGYDNEIATIWWYHTSTTYTPVGSTTVYNTEDSETFRFTNMVPGEEYVLYAKIVYYNSGREVTHIISAEITTNGSAGVDGAQISLCDRTGTTITVRIVGLDINYSRNDRKISWSINNSLKDTVILSPGEPESSTYTFTELTPCTNYTIGAVIKYTSGGSPLEKKLDDVYCSTANWATKQESGLGTVSSAKTVSWTLKQATVSYASVTFSKAGTATIFSSGNYDIVGYLSTSTAFDNTNGYPNSYLVSNDDDGEANNFSLTYSVKAGTTYYIWAKGYGTSTSVGNISITVDISDKPVDFAWTYEKVSGQEFNLTATEWKALQDKVNEVRAYLSTRYSDSRITQWPSGKLTDGVTCFTTPSKGQDFTAIHYNQVLMAIAGAFEVRGTSGYYDQYSVAPNDDVTAKCMNRLVTLVNALIDA